MVLFFIFIYMKALSEYIIEGLLDNKLLKPLKDFIVKNFKKKVGFKELIKVSIQGDKYEFTATMDTGNGGVVPTLGVDKMNVDGDKVNITIGDKEYTFDKKGEASPTVGNVTHHRPIIIIDYIEIGGRKLNEPFIAVTDERKKSTKSLINRDTMSKLNLVVDPAKNSLIKEKLYLDKDINTNNLYLDEELLYDLLIDNSYEYYDKILNVFKDYLSENGIHELEDENFHILTAMEEKTTAHKVYKNHKEFLNKLEFVQFSELSKYKKYVQHKEYRKFENERYFIYVRDYILSFLDVKDNKKFIFCYD